MSSSGVFTIAPLPVGGGAGDWGRRVTAGGDAMVAVSGGKW